MNKFKSYFDFRGLRNTFRGVGVGGGGSSPLMGFHPVPRPAQDAPQQQYFQIMESGLAQTRISHTDVFE